MTTEEFKARVSAIEENDYSHNRTGECLAYALLQGRWEFQNIGYSRVVLATNTGEQAVVEVRNCCKMPGYYAYLLANGAVQVLEAAESLNEVMVFLNQET